MKQSGKSRIVLWLGISLLLSHAGLVYAQETVSGNIGEITSPITEGSVSDSDRDEDQGDTLQLEVEIPIGDSKDKREAVDSKEQGKLPILQEKEEKPSNLLGQKAYPDNRVAQWNMGNCSGNYGNSFDTYSNFDDNVIAALYPLENDTYQLELTGNGEMAGVGDYSYQPYRAYREKITRVVVGEGITNVGKEAFSHLIHLQEYTLPESVKTIGENAFGYCTSLTNIVILDTVDKLENYCFQKCSAVTSLTIPGDLDYTHLRIPFEEICHLTDIWITPGKTGIASVEQTIPWSPADRSDGYTIHIQEGVTKIADKIFADTKASRIEIADSVTTIGVDAFAKDAYSKTTIPTYLVLGENTRSIDPKAFMAAKEGITPTIVEIGNVYQYEYHWAAVHREVSFVVRRNALKELTEMVERDIEEGSLVQEDDFPLSKWQELLEELERANGYLQEEKSDQNALTECFIRLYSLSHHKRTASYVVSLPAFLELEEDEANHQVRGEIPIAVKYWFPDSTFQLSVEVNPDSLTMRDKLSERTFSLSAQTEGTRWDNNKEETTIDKEGFRCGKGKITLSGEQQPGDWGGILQVMIRCKQEKEKGEK